MFAENHISGKELATLESDDLREMGVTSIGHRKKIMAAMAEFRTANTRIKRIAIEVLSTDYFLKTARIPEST